MKRTSPEINFYLLSEVEERVAFSKFETSGPTLNASWKLNRVSSRTRLSLMIEGDINMLVSSCVFGD